MAITKIHPIKSTLKKALDYICDPEKTEDKLLVSSFGCAPATADIEFDMTRRWAKYKAATVLARHMIQSFAPGETTSERAHEIGRQWADEVLGGKYEYVIATHVDKGHVHNHVIFNNVDLLDHKRYQSNRVSYRKLRQASDHICAENGLSVIENPVAKNIGRKEYEERKRGASTKGSLQRDIDAAVANAGSYEKFLQNMTARGYEVKAGKHIAFRAEGMERFARAKTLGERYTEEAIRRRIAERRSSRRNRIYQPNILKVGLVAGIRARMLVRSRQPALSQWQKVRLLKETANTINFLTAQKITAFSELGVAIGRLDVEFAQTRQSIKGIEAQLRPAAETIADLTKYQRLKPIAEQYKRVWNKEKFLEKYERELIVFAAAERALDAQGIDKTQPVAELKQNYQQLVGRKEELYKGYRQLERERQNFQNARENVRGLLQRPQKQQEQEQERGR